MNLFTEDIYYNEQEKERKFLHSLSSFDENEFITKTIEDIINEQYDKFKYHDLPEIEYNNPFLIENPLIDRNNMNLNIYIPLKGNSSSFQYRPFSQQLMCYQYYAYVDEKANALCMNVIVKNKIDFDIDSYIEKIINDRRHNIDIQYTYLKKDISLHNQKLKQYIEKELKKLYEQVKIKRQLEEHTKNSKYLKIIPKSTEPIKIIETKIETATDKVNKPSNKDKQTLMLEEKSYLQIYNSLNELSIYANRLPKSYNKLDEEDIRDQIINTLNLKLKTASATGETFNVSGKTDIIIVDNKVIYFIAECKIWKGTQKFSEAIDQLLSYISDDILYSSLIIFNKNKGNINDRALETIKQHKNYIYEIEKNRFEFKHPKNNNKLELSLIVFDVYN